MWVRDCVSKFRVCCLLFNLQSFCDDIIEIDTVSVFKQICKTMQHGNLR